MSLPPHPGDGRAAQEVLARGLQELAAPLPDPTLDRLAALAGLVAHWGRRLNLTAHPTAEAIAGRLILDALALAQVLPDFAGLADLGSGAGFPGLPLAIVHPDRQVTLVEARQRRHHFQRAAVRELGLANVQPRLGRAEQIEPEPHDAVIAQAVARPARALAWMIPWARDGGHLLLPGGESVPEVGPHPQVRALVVVPYQVPLGGPKRTLWHGVRVVARPEVSR